MRRNWKYVLLNVDVSEDVLDPQSITIKVLYEEAWVGSIKGGMPVMESTEEKAQPFPLWAVLRSHGLMVLFYTRTQ